VRVGANTCWAAFVGLQKNERRSELENCLAADFYHKINHLKFSLLEIVFTPPPPFKMEGKSILNFLEKFNLQSERCKNSI
jgi:hypothetical protein